MDNSTVGTAVTMAISAVMATITALEARVRHSNGTLTAELIWAVGTVVLAAITALAAQVCYTKIRGKQGLRVVGAPGDFTFIATDGAAVGRAAASTAAAEDAGVSSASGATAAHIPMDSTARCAAALGQPPVGKAPASDGEASDFGDYAEAELQGQHRGMLFLVGGTLMAKSQDGAASSGTFGFSSDGATAVSTATGSTTSSPTAADATGSASALARRKCAHSLALLPPAQRPRRQRALRRAPRIPASCRSQA